MKIEFLATSKLKKCYLLFPPRARRKIALAMVFQIAIAFLDLVGIGLLGLIGVLAIRGVESVSQGVRTRAILKFFHLNHLAFQQQALFIALAAAMALVARTLLSIQISRRTLFFIGNQSALLSTELISKVINRSIVSINSRSLQETLYSVTSGVEKITFGIIGILTNIVGDGGLLIILFFALVATNFLLSIASFALFFTVGAVLYKSLNRKAQLLGVRDSQLQVLSYQRISEILGSYREIFVRGRRSYYVQDISRVRQEYSEVVAENTFMPSISKYVIEGVLVVGSLLLSAIELTTQDSAHSFATLTVFLAAGTRIAPAVLRIQQNSLTIRNNLGMASSTLNLIDELGSSSTLSNHMPSLDLRHAGFEGSIYVEGVSYSYPNQESFALKDVNLQIESGEFVALVGPSGAGKTTLVDLILGIVPCETGDVYISGETPLRAITLWPGAIGYVPQDVNVISGTIKSNIALGFESGDIDDVQVAYAIEIAHLSNFVAQLPNGADTELMDKGSNMSGGQRQRVGIARALYTGPKILVLDEATSSLDADTEESISQSINSLRGATTILMIAHRLSSVRAADKVIYLESGNVRCVGSFEHVRKSIPDFDRQAKLMGL